MSLQLNRRQWLRTSALAVAGLSLAGRAKSFNRLESFEFLTQENDDLILLDQNENPYGISKKTQEAIAGEVKYSNRYPDDHTTELKKLISGRENVSPDNIILGAGATEIFRISGLLYGLNGGEIITADPTYFGFVSYVERLGGKLKMVRVDNEYKHDLNAMARQITDTTKMVYVVNPNNPTGTIVGGDELRSFCEEVSHSVPVFVDEAYHELVEDDGYSSMTGLVREGHNVIVARTFSKIFGMAGLRVGYGIAKPEIIREFSRIQTNFAPVSVLSLRAAAASYQDTDFISSCLRKNNEARAYFCEVLDKLGYFYIPSHTNFVIFKINRSAREFVGEVLKNKIRIRSFEFHDEQWIRVSIGTMNEMRALAPILEKMS
ncbi:hypothetical protein AMJ80_07465 [bacterium SM23_31]|nr:MAG: hypothetical protein AMJ80_07465 [bacterium SM23_31]